MTINSNGDATSGEVRLATRQSVFPEDWRYQTLDGPDLGTAIAGYGTAITHDNGAIWAVWFSTKSHDSVHQKVLVRSNLSEEGLLNSISFAHFGNTSGSLANRKSLIIFDCNRRLCLVDSVGKVKLLTPKTNFERGVTILLNGASPFFVASLGKRLTQIDFFTA